jgi:hypothetical protein
MRRLADEAERMVVPDWSDDPLEVQTVATAAVIADVHPETVRRWCAEARMVAGTPTRQWLGVICADAAAH